MPLDLKTAGAVSETALDQALPKMSAAEQPSGHIKGVYVGNHSADVDEFEDWLGKPVEGVLTYTGGPEADWAGLHPGWQINMPEYLGGSPAEKLWSLAMAPDNSTVDDYWAIARGEHNDDYGAWAEAILDSRAGDDRPIYVRTTWEVGGEWFPWTAIAEADPQAYKQAWGQFADTFHTVSDRFQMVWDFAGDRDQPLESWYPGDDKVDVISQDIYWMPQFTGSDPVAAFDFVENQMAHPLSWMADFAAEHGKPMAISEWGVPGTDYAGELFIEKLSAWMDVHDVVYSNYWNSTVAFDGMLSDGDPAASAAALYNFFHDQQII